jgi:hypothetical protein
MNASELIPGLFIHLVVPLAGLIWYVKLCRQLRKQGAPTGLSKQLFIIFLCWGGVLLELLTAMLWQWSGLAAVGMFFLVFVAPVLLFFVTLGLKRQKPQFRAERIALYACYGYYALIILGLFFVALR